MVNELKPCPFCGGRNLTTIWNNNRIWLECVDCDARTKSMYSPNVKENQGDSEAKAITAWNTRPAPAATDTGQVTVKRELLEAVKFFDDFPPSIQRMSNIRVVEAAHKYIEQAEKLLAAERAESERLRALLKTQSDAHAKHVKGLLAQHEREREIYGQAAQDFRQRAEKAEANLEFIERVKGVNEKYANALAFLEMTENDDPEEFAECFWNKFIALEADNAAQAARIKELEEINANLMGDDEDKPRYTTKRLKQEIAQATEALEAKLAAAEKDAATMEANYKALDAHYARAVLGGKP